MAGHPACNMRFQLSRQVHKQPISRPGSHTAATPRQEHLDAADEAGVGPVVGEGQRRGDGGPDAEDDVNAEEHEEYGVRERAVLDRRVVHAHVPGRQRSSASANCLPALSLSLAAGNPAIASGSRRPCLVYPAAVAGHLDGVR